MSSYRREGYVHDDLFLQKTKNKTNLIQVFKVIIFLYIYVIRMSKLTKLRFYGTVLSN